MCTRYTYGTWENLQIQHLTNEKKKPLLSFVVLNKKNAILKMKFYKNYYCCTSGKNNPQNWKYIPNQILYYFSFFVVFFFFLVVHMNYFRVWYLLHRNILSIYDRIHECMEIIFDHFKAKCLWNMNTTANRSNKE